MTPYYTREGITLYHADCMDVLPTLERVDHLISDPPYSAASHAMHDRGKTVARELDGLSRDELTFEHVDGEYLAHLLTVAPVARWAVFTMDDRLTAWLRMNTPCEWHYTRTGIWFKPGSMPQFTGDRPAMGYEPVVVMHRRGVRMRWNGGGKAGIWKHTVVHGEHPTQKPLGLYEAFVSDFTDPGELILDPFAGSGTTGVAAFNLGRKAILIEREEKYCEVAAKRLESLTPPLFTMPSEKPIQATWDTVGGFEWMHTVGHGDLEEPA